MSIRTILCFRFKLQSDGNIHSINFLVLFGFNYDSGNSVVYTNKNAKQKMNMRNKKR